MRSAIRGTKITESEREKCSADMLQDFLKHSAKHDAIHLLDLGLKKNELISKNNAEIEKYILKVVYRYERLRYAYENRCVTPEKSKIEFLWLRGSVIRKHYSDAWMRTSCDIDTLA